MNRIPKLGDLLILAELILLESFARFFKPEHNSNLQKGDQIVRLELFRSENHVLSWKLCRNGKGVLVWVFVGADDIQFNNKVNNNIIMALKIEVQCAGGNFDVEW